MKSTTLLLDDHKRLLLGSGVLTEMAAAAERGHAVNATDLADLLRFFEEFGDRHHQGVEECVLFPALLHDPAQKNYHALCALVFEHERERSLIDGLHDSLLTKNTQDFIYCARRFSEVLRGHIKDEEGALFPLVESTLSTADDERLEQEMRAFDKAWQERELSSQLQRLSEMASRYFTARNARTA